MESVRFNAKADADATSRANVALFRIKSKGLRRILLSPLRRRYGGRMDSDSLSPRRIFMLYRGVEIGLFIRGCRFVPGRPAVRAFGRQALLPRDERCSA